MNKRGLSGVLIMILLILLAIAGVVIIWGFAKTVVFSSSEDIATSSVIFGSVFDGYVSRYTEYADLDEVVMEISLVKIAGDLDSDKLRIIFEDKEGDKFQRIVDVGFKLYEGKKVGVLFYDTLNFPENLPDVKFNVKETIKIYIYPIYVLSSGKQKIGEVPTILIRQESVFKSKTNKKGGGGSTPPLDNNWCGNADINRDGKVDSLDNDKIALYYGACSLILNQDGTTSEKSWCSLADINRDGKVDTSDLQILGDYIDRGVNLIPQGVRCDATNNNCDNSDLFPDGISTTGDFFKFVEFFGQGARGDVICEDGEGGNECCENNDIDRDKDFDPDDLKALGNSLGRTGCSGSLAVCSYSP